MAKLINGKVTYEGGEALPMVGSSAYQAAQAGEIHPNNSYTGVNQPDGSVISMADLQPAQPLNIQSPAPATETAGLDGYLSTQATQFKTDQAQKEAFRLKQIEKDTSQQAYLNKALNQKGEIQQTDEAYSTGGVNTAEDELNDINNQIVAEQQANRRRIEALQKNPQGLFGGALSQEVERINRESLAKQADLSVIQMAKQGKYDSAKRIADRKVAMQLEKDKNELDALKFTYEENKDSFNKAEERQYNEMITEKENAYKKKEADLKTIQDMAFAAQEGGAPTSIATQMLGAKTIEDAMRIGGSYIGSLDRQKAELELAKLRNEVSSGAPITGEYASVINGAAGLVPATKRGTTKQNIASAIANGDYVTAYAEVANAVSDGLTGTNKTKFDDARTDIGVLQGMRNAIQEYADGGGDMGLLKGTEEDIKRKLGIDSGKATALATQLWREFQSYRSNMTGAAFSPNESRDYASVNPTLGKSIDLNLSVIDGALAQLNNRIVSTVNARLPGASKIYDLANSGGNDVKPIVDASNTEINGLEVKLPSGEIWIAPTLDALNKFKTKYGL